MKTIIYASVAVLRQAIFFPRVILYNFFLFWLIYGGFGFWGGGLILGFGGRGFQLMGFGSCGVGPSGFVLGWGSLYKHKRITVGKNGANVSLHQ